MDNDKSKMLQLLQLTLFSVTKGIWDFVGESSLALSLKIGDELLKIFEYERHLQLADQTPSMIISSIVQIFQEEFHFAENIEVSQNKNIFAIHVHNCHNNTLTHRLSVAGVEKPFVCPLMNVLLAAFKKLHITARHDIKRDNKQNHSIITLEII
ncbi:hypothetical protein JW964_15745 [candidate division KSB1 bacterium]|nr:hypothetical protein [candidate division KSB1 bacterium]